MGQFLLKHRWLLLISLLSLLLKLAFVLQGAVVNPDAATYIAAADKYSQGLFSEGLKYYRMPFYPLLLTAVHVIVPDWIVAGRLLTVVPLWLTLFPLYALTRRLFSHHSALWTALLFAVIPTFNTSSADIKRDPLFLLFTITALLFLVMFFQHHRKRDIVWFSFLTVLATLTRIEGVILPVVALVSAPICGWGKGGLKFVTRTVLGLITVPLFLMLLLWGLELMGLSTTSRLNEVMFWIEKFANLKLFAGYQNLMASLKEFQSTLPRADLHNNLIEVTRHYAPLIYLIGLMEMMAKAIFPTSLLALWALRCAEKKAFLVESWVLLLTWFGFFSLNVLFCLTKNFTTERYLWIPIILTFPLLGYGVSLWWEKRELRPLISTLIVALIIVAPLVKTVAVASKKQDTTIQTASQWLRDYDPQCQISVLYNDRRFPLYAERVSEVNKVRKLSYLRKSAQRNKGVDLVALYLSTSKNEDYQIQGFNLIQQFKGDRKTVVVFKRRIQGD